MGEEALPSFILRLEERLKTIKEQRQLGHEVGAGSACLKCQDKCPGLELHYWRKRCIACKCGKEDHDIPPEDSSMKFEILFSKDGAKRVKPLTAVLDMKIKTDKENTVPQQKEDESNRTTKKVNFDWIPPDISPEMAAEYMDQLPVKKAPISGSTGAKYRSMQFEKQIPLHDINPEMSQRLSPDAQKRFSEYLENMCENVVGQAKVQKLCQKQFVENSVPYYVLPEPQCSTAPEKKKNETDHLASSLQNLNIPSFPTNMNTNTGSSMRNTPSIIQPPRLRLPSSFIPAESKLINSNEENKTANLNDPIIHELPSATNVSKLPRSYDDLRRLRSFQPHQDPGRNLDVINSNESVPDNQILHTEKTVMNCQQCRNELQSIAVTADRAGPGVAWHPQCFICSVCQELLVDLIYFYHNKEILCGRHYAEKLKIPRCFACDELIFVKEYTMAEGNAFHIEHFCCVECDTALAGKQYVSNNNHPTCLPCYETIYCKICNTCKCPIRANDEGVKLNQIDWHATDRCFTCACCKRSLLNGKVSLRKGNLFCSTDCINNFTAI